MGKVITIGEVLIDFIPNKKGSALKDVEGFVKKPGGAPANVAVAVSRLGGKSAFIGKVGKDGFGDFLVEVLEENQVNTDGVVQSTEALTALAFVTLTAEGERDFSFYRNPSADMLLHEDEIIEEQFEEGDILHFCSVDLIEAPVKYAHKKAIEYSKAHGGIISFDPNVRLPLWNSPQECKEAILEFIHFADILKLSEEELEFITDIKDEKMAIGELKKLCKESVVILITKGGDGVELYTQSSVVKQAAFEIVVDDTTGAGDSFIGAFLYKLALKVDNHKELQNVSLEEYKDILLFANGVGALTTMNEGAISALPYMSDVEAFLKERVGN